MLNIFRKKKTTIIKKKEQHEVYVYDENMNIINKTMEGLHVAYLSRCKHTFKSYTAYSWNIHYFDGMIYYGLVPLPPFNHHLFKE